MSGAARILITGGTGFFGKSLLAARKRKAVPEGELVILSRDPEGFLCRFPAFAGLPGVSFAAGDVRDFPFPDGEFSAVLHAATPASARLEAENPAEMRSIIVDGTKRVLDFCCSRKVPRLLLTSSGAVYGPQEPECERMAETHPCRPVTAYGQGKLEAERLCLDSGVERVIARCFAFVGPYLPLGIHFAAGNFLRDALENRPIAIRGDGRPLRSYLYADDLVRWLRRLLEAGEPGRIYNVGSENAVSIAELAERCAALRTPPSAVTVLGHPDGLPAPRYLPDTARARRELGLAETVNLDEALRLTFEFHRNNGYCMKNQQGEKS